MNEAQIRDKLKNIRCFLLDMDGTFYLGKNLIPGAMDFLEALEKTGRTARFVTNNSSRSSLAYRERLAGFGVPEKYRDVITSAHAAAHYLKDRFPEGKGYLMGNHILRQELEEMGLAFTEEEDADYVLAAFDTELTYQKLCRVCDLVRAGKPYIATHPDFVCPTETGSIPDTGSMMALIEAATGRKADIILGKPNRGIVDEALRRTGFPLTELAMVGDRLYTDVATGTKNGCTGILVLSGEATMKDVEESDIVPDLIFPSLYHMIPYL